MTKENAEINMILIGGRQQERAPVDGLQTSDELLIGLVLVALD